MLFPPIIDSYLPAFKKNEDVRIYFSMGKYNSPEQIKTVHCKVKRVDNGESLLKKDLYPSGIKVTTFMKEENSVLYYITIPFSDIEWEERTYYNVQLRFSTLNNNLSFYPSSWFSENQSSFSEWSRTSITKCIGDVKIKIPLFPVEDGYTEDTVLTLENISTLTIEGSFINDSDPLENLDNISFRLLDGTENVIEEVEGEIENGQFSVFFLSPMEDSKKYALEYSFTTVNGYVGKEKVSFTVLNPEGEIVPAAISFITETDEDFYNSCDGAVSILIKSLNGEKFTGNINLQRAEKKESFSKWVDIENFALIDEEIELCFYDIFVESGETYQYRIRKVDASDTSEVKNYGKPVYSEEITVGVFDSSYLINQDGTQIELAYSLKLGDVSNNVSTQVIDTFGKYPIIMSNETKKYRRFTFNAIISANVNDEYKDFSAKEEKDFRDDIVRRIEDCEPKIFKSSKEGNILCTVVEVYTTPIESLGRKIYELSGTIVEIGDFSYQKLVELNFIKVSDLQTSFYEKETKIGQVIIENGKDTNIKKLIEDKYSYDGQRILGYKYTVADIRKISIIFDSDKKIFEGDGIFRPFLGYKIKVNDQEIKVSFGNIYNIDSRIPLRSLYLVCPKDEVYSRVIVNFICDIKKEKIREKTIVSRKTFKKYGQIFGSFSSGDTFYSTIFYKYYYQKTFKYQKIIKISNLQFEGQPNTVVLVKDKSDKKIEYHVIGETCKLRLIDSAKNESSFSDFGVYGKIVGNFNDLKDDIETSENGELILKTTNKKVKILDGKVCDIESKIDISCTYKFYLEKGNY